MFVQLHPQFIVDQNGERKSVMLSIAEFEAMLEEREDYADALLLHRMAWKRSPTTSVRWKQ